MASKLKIFKELFKHKKLITQFPTLVRMVKATMRRQYTPKKKNLIVPALALVYIISPLDILPDWIPIIGSLDDIALLAIALPMLTEELSAYAAWEERQRGIKTLDAEIINES